MAVRAAAVAGFTHPGRIGYLDDGGSFPERLHIIIPFALLFADLFKTLLTWADQMERDVGEWPSTKDVGMTPAARRQLEEAAADIGAFMAG